MASTLEQRMTGTPEARRLLEQEKAILEVTELIYRVMHEQGVSKAGLARRINTSKANVTQILDGERNMTIRTVADILFSLGQSLVVNGKAIDDDNEIRSVHFWVHRKSWRAPSTRFAVESAKSRVLAS